MLVTKRTTSLTIMLAAALVVPGCGKSKPETPQSSAAGTAATLLADSAGHSSAGDSLIARADSARIEGSPTAPIWIIEVSDFQCPFCRSFHAETYPTIKQDYVATGKARLAYLNFPIESLHKNAWPAALAAMCAAAQDKFWPMHDALFNAQDRWASQSDPTPVLDSLASSIGVDRRPFDACLSSKAMLPLVQADKERAEERGANSTPTFFIGSQKIEGAESIDVFRRVIDAELAKAAGGRGTSHG